MSELGSALYQLLIQHPHGVPSMVNENGIWKAKRFNVFVLTKEELSSCDSASPSTVLHNIKNLLQEKGKLR